MAPAATDRWRVLALAGVAALVCWLGPGAACWAQEEAFCHLNRVDVEQLSNAVRVTLRADGVLHTQADWQQFFEEVAPEHWRRRRAKRFSFQLTNARSEVGAFVNVGQYPVSHLEIAIVPEAVGGVGLEVTLALYSRAEARRIRLGNMRISGWGFEEETNEVDIRIGQNRRSLIIVATSDRYVDVKAKPPAARHLMKLPKELAVRHSEGLLDLHALNVPLGEILDAIGRESGCAITAGDLRPHLVTLHLERVPLSAVMNGLARAYALTVTPLARSPDEPEGYVVTEGLPTSASSYGLGDLRALPVHNISAETAGELLPNCLESYVHTDPERNALVVGGPPEMLDKVAADLAKIDQPVPQIQVEAIFVEAASMVRLAAWLDLHFVDGTSEVDLQSLGGDISYHIVRGAEDLDIRLSALEEKSLVRTVARPQVTVVNGGRGEVFVGEERLFPFRASGYRRGQEIIVASVDVGTRLRVYPWTGGAETTIRVSTRANTVLRVDRRGLPTVSAREARGVVRLGHAELVLIGGLELAQSERSRRKVPVLGDVPVVGAAFRSKLKESGATELAVFLRARVVDAAGQAISPHTAAARGPSEERRTPS